MVEFEGEATISASCGSGLHRYSPRGTAHRSAFRVSGVSIEISSERDDDVALVPSLGPFRIETDRPDIQIHVEWADGLSTTFRKRLFDSGSIWRLFEHPAGLQFDFNVPSLVVQPYKRLVVDDGFRQATLQMNGEFFKGGVRSAIPLEYPLDELLVVHRLTQESAIELHGCGIVGADGKGNLFVGHSGAGKSTTARLWASHEDVQILSDDRIIVRHHEHEPPVEIPRRAGHSPEEREVPRLRDRPASRISHYAQDDRREESGAGIRMYGTPWHGEAAFASPANAALSRILILEHGRGNVLTRLSPSRAVAELFARSFVPFHRHEYLENALTFLEEVAGSIPCYRYSFEPDEHAVDTILNFHD
jgi:hypothetical protein